MTTFEQIQKMRDELDKLEKEYNSMHRKAKYFKKDVLQPKQAEYRSLWEKWKNEIKNSS